MRPSSPPLSRTARFVPSPELRDIVEGIWIQEYDEPGGSSCVVPTGTIELLFNYRAPLVHKDGADVIRLPRSYIAGPRRRPVFPSATGPTGTVLVSLPPWGAACLFPGIREHADAYTDLRLLFPGGSVAELEERLGAASGHEERCELVQRFIAAHRLRQADPRMVEAVRRLAGDASSGSVAALATRFGLSPRHFGRTFQATVGMSPKTFSRVMRFQRALGARRPGASWADISARCGYSDQSHLIREFREFALRSPGDLPGRPEQRHEPFNGGSASSYFHTVYL